MVKCHTLIVGDTRHFEYKGVYLGKFVESHLARMGSGEGTQIVTLYRFENEYHPVTKSLFPQDDVNPTEGIPTEGIPTDRINFSATR